MMPQYLGRILRPMDVEDSLPPVKGPRVPAWSLVNDVDHMVCVWVAKKKDTRSGGKVYGRYDMMLQMCFFLVVFCYIGKPSWNK